MNLLFWGIFLDLKLILLLKGLIERGVVNGLSPFMFAKMNVTKKTVDATLETYVFTIQLSTLRNNYSFTCSVSPFSSYSRLTIMLFSFYKTSRASFRNHSLISRIYLILTYGSLTGSGCSFIGSGFGSSDFLGAFFPLLGSFFYFDGSLRLSLC